MAFAEGQQIGQYKIVGQIGHGGMATIYKAYHARLDRYVAIKVLHQGFLQDENFLARFEREARIVAKLEHPNIVPIYDFADVDGQPYLVMKYLEGHTLKAMSARNGVSLNEILRIMPPIASALDFAHRDGVLHRDIKPSNIIIGEDGTPYLTDFGLARMAQMGESTLSADVLLGTPNYISPEQAMGRRDVDARTDLYSLGVVLYELVTGRVPFNADTPYAVIHDHIYTALPAPRSINPEIPTQVEAVLVKALAKNPDDRYNSAGEMITAFAAAVRTSGLKSLRVQHQIDSTEAETPDAAFDPFEAVINHLDAEEHRDTVLLDMPPATPKSHPPRRNLSVNLNDGKLNANVQWGDTQKSWQLDTDKLNQQLNDAGKKVNDALQSAISEDHTPDEKPKNKPNPWKEAGTALIDAIEDSVENISGDDGLYLDTPEAARKRAKKQVDKRHEFSIHLAVYVVINILLWVIFGTTGIIGGNFPFPLMVMFGWGAGLVAHAIETYYETGKRAAKKTQMIFDACYRAYGPNWGRQDRKALRKIRRAVEKPVNKRREFLQHLSVYSMIIPLLWIIFGFTTGLTDSGFPWPLLAMLGWGIGLVAHGIDTLNAVREDTAVERQIEREAQYLYDAGSSRSKRKNDDMSLDQLQGDDPETRLSSDGELTDSMVDQLRQDDPQSRKR
ncbi:MAG: protein kinase [Anaerolineae bacterium]|nr:protein kinase [Anaerolineae bacterium]